MIVNNWRKFVFIHIPKNAGTSITSVLSAVWRPDRSAISHNTKHETYSEFLKFYQERTWRNPERLEPYLKISVIRNPWSRFFSLHSYLIKARPRKDLDIPEDINDFASLLANESPEWMKTIRSLRPQIDFIECAENNLALLYYETLSADFEQLSHRINVAAPLPHQNKSNSQKADYRAFLAPKTVDFVTDKFIADVERFNYKFE